MPEYVRVKDKETGHEYSTNRYSADVHTKLDKPAVGPGGEVLPMKPKTTVAKQAAGKKAAESADKSDNTSPKEK